MNAASSQLEDMLVQLGVKREIIEVFPYGIDLESMPLRPKATSNARYRLISNRHWGREYRVDNVLEGFEKYAEEWDDLDLVITGRGPAPSDEMRIRQIVARSKFPDRIELRGFVSEHELREEIYRADLFISIPRTDGAPTSLLEAMTAGLLPIVSDIPPNRAWIDSTRGIVVVRFDGDSIKRALREGVLKVQSGFDPRPNRALIQERANYRKNIERLRDVYTCISAR
jgi:alpha-1,3-mannosyltransferase